MKKEEIKEEIKKEIENKVDEYVDGLIKDLNGETFDISKLEQSIGESINEFQNLLMKTTENILNSKAEKNIIVKKKRMERKRTQIRKSRKTKYINNFTIWKNNTVSNYT